MKWDRLLGVLSGEVLFRSSLLLSEVEDASTIRRQLVRWVRTGKLLKLRRGVYAVAPPFRSHAPHPFAVAAILHPSSFVSLQSALAHYALIPEHVPTVTSVTGGRPETLVTPIGRFVYRHVLPRLCTGSVRVGFGDNEFAFVATPEKAILDIAYLDADTEVEEYLRGLRLQNLQALDIGRMEELAIGYRSPRLRRVAICVAHLAREEQA